MLKVIIRLRQRRVRVPPLCFPMHQRPLPFQHNEIHRASSHQATVVTEDCGKSFTRKLVIRGVIRTDNSTTTPPQHQPVDVYVTRNAAHVKSWIQTHLGMSPPIHDQNHHQNNTSSSSLSSSSVVGFDVEWRPNFNAGGMQNKTALVQLASHTSALLIQMKPSPSQSSSTTWTRRQGQELGPRGKSGGVDDDHRELLQTLGWLLNSPHILKVGVGVAEDLEKLQRDFDLPFCHFMDLGVAAQRHARLSAAQEHLRDRRAGGSRRETFALNHSESSTDGGNNNYSSSSSSVVICKKRPLIDVEDDEDEKPKKISRNHLHEQQDRLPPSSSSSLSDPVGSSEPLRKFGLQSLVQHYLGLSLSKPRNVRLSNWEVVELTDAQVMYAALDAYYGRCVYDQLAERGAFVPQTQTRFIDYLFLLEQLLLAQPQSAKQPQQTNNNSNNNNSSSGGSSSNTDVLNGGVNGGTSELELLSLLMSKHTHHNGHNDLTITGSDCDDIDLGGDGDDVGKGVPGLTSSSMHLAKRMMRCLLDNDDKKGEDRGEDQGDHGNDNNHTLATSKNNSHEPAASASGPGLALESVGLTRTSFRRLWLGAGCESEDMAWTVGDKVQREDRDWLHSLELRASAPTSSSSSSSLWRLALMSYLSRLGWVYSIQTDATGPGLDTEPGPGVPSSTKGPVLVHVSVTVMVQSEGTTRVGVLARGAERTRAKASEVACQRALTHLITQVQSQVPPDEILTIFAGKKDTYRSATTMPATGNGARNSNAFDDYIHTLTCTSNLLSNNDKVNK